jgi:HEAT repeat protein
VRKAAAIAAARIDPEAAAKQIGGDLRGDTAVHAAEAIALLAQRAGDRAAEQPPLENLPKAVEKALKSKEGPVRAAAVRGIVALPVAERPERLTKAAEDADLGVAAAALDEVLRLKDPALFPLLLERMRAHPSNDVLDRRAAAAILAIVASVPEDDRKVRVAELSAALSASKEGAPAARIADVLGRLGARPGPPAEAPADGAAPAPPAAPAVPAAEALGALQPALTHRSDAARAAAVRALGRIATDEAVEKATALATTDASARVRFQAIDAVARAKGPADPAALALLTERLAKDADPSVREQAAVLLGVSGPEKAPFDAPVEALAKALADEQWTVACVAAVSLGKTRSPQAAAALEPLLEAKKTKDWRRRGAAVVGLGTMQRKEGVPGLIVALADKDPYVRKTAFEFLRRMTTRNISAEVEPWKAWWDKQGPTYEFVDREKIAKEMKKGGYAVKPEEAYEKVGTARMDVVVLQSRGDHIEKLLTKLGIEHRITRQAQVGEAELHPYGVFVSNCTGEIGGGDVERLAWFVRVGGYVFGSCWALQHTVEKIYPGLVRKLPTKAEVLDNVVAEPCPVATPYLEGVFPSFTRPIYVLFGSHLIEVLQQERVEVLMDSPDAATRWGGGNLSCWFPAGHGVILDSANHFDLQGLERATGLKNARDRMAYAMDHMGVDYDEARRLADGKVWDSHTDAVENVRDFSMFRFITNFVKAKRRAID